MNSFFHRKINPLTTKKHNFFLFFFLSQINLMITIKYEFSFITNESFDNDRIKERLKIPIGWLWSMAYSRNDRLE